MRALLGRKQRGSQAARAIFYLVTHAFCANNNMSHLFLFPSAAGRVAQIEFSPPVIKRQIGFAIVHTTPTMMPQYTAGTSSPKWAKSILIGTKHIE